MTSPLRITIRTDGASRGNPGPAGAGAVIAAADGQILARLSRYLGRTTNNCAEYAALLMALEAALELRPDHADIFLDSELVVRHLQGLYRVRSEDIRPLYERARGLLKRFPSFTLSHVPRGANAGADALANAAIDGQRGSITGAG